MYTIFSRRFKDIGVFEAVKAGVLKETNKYTNLPEDVKSRISIIERDNYILIKNSMPFIDCHYAIKFISERFSNKIYIATSMQSDKRAEFFAYAWDIVPEIFTELFQIEDWTLEVIRKDVSTEAIETPLLVGVLIS